MKKSFSKRITAAVLTVVIALSAAVVSGAFAGNWSSSPKETRLITVNTDKVITEDFEGVGNNHWVGPYYYNMNDAYQLLNEKRNATLEPSYMRMMFLPQWVVNLNDDAEVQEQKYLNGDYYFESVEFQNFMRKVKMYHESGTRVQINMGGRVTTKGGMSAWFGIQNVELSEAGTRSAPRNLEAFGHLGATIIKYADDRGWDNIRMVSFYNEVNGGNFEAFFDKRIYYSQMVKKMHEALAEAGYRDASDEDKYVRICGVDLAGYVTETPITSFIAYIAANCRVTAADKAADTANVKYKNREVGSAVYDYLATHEYQRNTYSGYFNKTAEESYTKVDTTGIYQITKELNNYVSDEYKYLGTDEYVDFSKERIYINEFGAGYLDGSNNRMHNYEYNETAQVIAHTNSGSSGEAYWFYLGEMIPDPMNVGQTDSNICDTAVPSRGTYTVSNNWATRGLPYRYVPDHSKVYDITVAGSNITGDNPSQTDIIASAYKSTAKTTADKQGYTVLMNIGPSEADRAVEIKFTGADKPAAGTKFRRHVFVCQGDVDGDGNAETTNYYSGYTDLGGNTLGGPNAILAPADQVLTVNDNGTISDTTGFPSSIDQTDADGNNVKSNQYIVVYTTIEEEVQIEMSTTKEWAQAEYTDKNTGTVDKDGKFTSDGTTKQISEYETIDFPVLPGETVDLSVLNIYGINDPDSQGKQTASSSQKSDVTWSIVGRAPNEWNTESAYTYTDTANSGVNATYDLYGSAYHGAGYGLTHSSEGTLSSDSGSSVTYTAASDAKVGDTIAIRIDYNKNGKSGYAIVIVSIGFKVNFKYKNDSKVETTVSRVFRYVPNINYYKSYLPKSFDDLTRDIKVGNTNNRDSAKEKIKGWTIEGGNSDSYDYIPESIETKAVNSTNPADAVCTFVAKQ